MHKTTYRLLTISLAGVLLCGMSFAQQTSAPATNPTASSSTATSKTQTATAAKSSTAKKAPAPLVLNTPKDKAAYAIGMGMGNNLRQNLKKNDAELNPDIIVRAMKDALMEKPALMTEQEAQAALTAFSKELQEEAAEKNKAFLEANKTKPGVVTLPSGLQYKILQQGDGPKPTASDTVVCNYSGQLINGDEFDSSAKHGKPLTIQVGQVIKGWGEALQLMPVGSKWQLFIPPNLAYGERGTPNGPIGPNAALIFEVELLSIQPKPEPKPGVGMLAPGAKPQAQPAGQPQTAGQSAPQPQAQPAPQTQEQPATQPQTKPQ